MGEIVSLKLHRKRKERAEKEERAAVNRAKSGRSRHEKDLTEARAEKAAKGLDAHKREE